MSLQVFDGEIGQARTDFACGDVFWEWRRTRRLLIAPDESDQTETQKQELSHHLFLLLHFENQQF
jgi:hypothetical protein